MSSPRRDLYLDRDRRTRSNDRAVTSLIGVLAWVAVSAGWHSSIRASALLSLAWLVATAAIHVSLWRMLSDASEPNDLRVTPTRLTAASLTLALLAMLLP